MARSSQTQKTVVPIVESIAVKKGKKEQTFRFLRSIIMKPMEELNSEFKSFGIIHLGQDIDIGEELDQTGLACLVKCGGSPKCLLLNKVTTDYLKKINVMKMEKREFIRFPSMAKIKIAK